MATARLVDVVSVYESAFEEDGRLLSMVMTQIVKNGGHSVVISNFNGVSVFVVLMFRYTKP